MKKKIKHLISNIAICVILVSSLSGCWNSRELSDLSIVTGVGIDKAEETGDISLTVQIVKPGEIKRPSKDSPGGEGTAYWNLKSSSQTIFDAVSELTHETNKKLYFSQTQVIILGKDIAADGVQKYLDFFIRDHEIRPTISILVASGAAGEVLDVKPEMDKLPAINLAKLAKSQGFSSHATTVNLLEFTSRLLSKTTSPIAPLVTITGENMKKLVHVEDMAVFKRDKLAGILNPAETRGLLWVIGKVERGAIDLDFPDGKATLEITNARSKVTPEIKDGKVYINIKIKEDSLLVSQMLPENLATVSSLPLLEKRQDEAIRSEILSALKKARDLNTDFFGFGDMVQKKYRTGWKQMEENWDAIFPNIEVQIEVESKIRAAGLIIKPATPEEEE